MVQCHVEKQHPVSLLAFEASAKFPTNNNTKSLNCFFSNKKGPYTISEVRAQKTSTFELS